VLIRNGVLFRARAVWGKIRILGVALGNADSGRLSGEHGSDIARSTAADVFDHQVDLVAFIRVHRAVAISAADVRIITASSTGWPGGIGCGVKHARPRVTATSLLRSQNSSLTATFAGPSLLVDQLAPHPSSHRLRLRCRRKGCWNPTEQVRCC